MSVSQSPTIHYSSDGRTYWRRQRVVGIDLWVDRRDGEEQIVDVARRAAAATHLRLVAVMGESADAEAGRATAVGALRLRFLARRDDVHVTDEAVAELMAGVSSVLRWSRLAKLVELDGTPDYCPLPTL